MAKPLDLFLLALITEGLATPYGWQTKARISLGASLPAVRRLIADGLIAEQDAGPRGRREFTLTRAGRRELSNLGLLLQDALEEPITDVDSILRLACLAIVNGKRGIAEKLLVQAAEEHNKRSRQAKKRTSIPTAESTLAELYSLVQTFWEADRQEASAGSLTALTTLLGLNVPGQTSSARKTRISSK